MPVGISQGELGEALTGLESVVNLIYLLAGLVDLGASRRGSESDENVRDVVIEFLGHRGRASRETQLHLAWGDDDRVNHLALLKLIQDHLLAGLLPVHAVVDSLRG